MTCSAPSCTKDVRARGLCITHYNQTHQPERHRYAEVPCDNCQTPCLKQVTAKYGARFCCLTCRDEWRRAGFDLDSRDAQRILLNSQRWRAAVHTIALQAQARYIRRCHLDELLAPRPCDDCGAVFEPQTTIQRYCKGSCARRVGRRVRRAAETGALGSFTWSEVMHLHLLFGRRCAYCEQHTDQPQPDHVVPLSRGGSNSLTNILPACRTCNSDKRDLLLNEWPADRARRGLPAVTTEWSAHDPRVMHLTTTTAQRTYAVVETDMADTLTHGRRAS